jgi:Coenzyme PQQ synthesis protein D (PqqD)
MIADQLTLATVIRRSDALLSTNLGDDVVMMDIEQGAYYGLEAVAARIWALTEQPVSVGSLCERLVSEYLISLEQCQAEVLAFVNELIGHHIVQVSS